MNTTEPTRLIRLNEVLFLLPISKSTWWKGVREKRYPQPVKLGNRITCWRLDEIVPLAEHGLTEEHNDARKFGKG